jgi:hypothetical protein
LMMIMVMLIVIMVMMMVVMMEQSLCWAICWTVPTWNVKMLSVNSAKARGAGWWRG